MSSRSRRSLLRRIDLRITLWFSLVFAAGALALFVLTYISLYQSLRDEDHDQLRHQLIQHWSQFRSAAHENTAVNELAKTLRSDAGALVGRPLFFRLATMSNATVFQGGLTEWSQTFNLEQLSEPQTPVTGRMLVLASDRLDYRLEIMGIRLSDNLVLQLGMSTAERQRLLDHFQGRFLIVVAVLLAVAVVGGAFFASRMLAPVIGLNDAIRRVVKTGELDRRLDYRPGNTDLQEMVGSFNQMLDRIQALVDAMHGALDAVAHDLRTPMTRFRNVAEAALSGPPEVETYREALSDAMEESERILHMLNSMMDISEAQSGAMPLRTEEIDLAALLRQVVDVYEFLAEEAQMRIDLHVAGHVSLSADPARLRQVVGNLLDNAVKYGRPGTAVTVTAQPVPETTTQPAAVQIRVHNRGPGVSEEIRDQIWQRLYRGPEVGATEGVGLGLTLVRAIVEAHDGWVEVQSEPGEYAEFRVCLPTANLSHM